MVTTSRAWAGATATTSCSRASSSCSGSTAAHLAKSPAQWDPAKLALGQRALHQAGRRRAAGGARRASSCAARGIAVPTADAQLARACALFKDRCATTVELADWLPMYFGRRQPTDEDLAAHVTDAVQPGAARAARAAAPRSNGTRPRSPQAIKETLAAHRLKMPQLAHAAARAGVRPRADAVDRCGAGAVPARSGARRACEA